MSLSPPQPNQIEVSSPRRLFRLEMTELNSRAMFAQGTHPGLLRTEACPENRRAQVGFSPVAVRYISLIERMPSLQLTIRNTRTPSLSGKGRGPPRCERAHQKLTNLATRGMAECGAEGL